MKYIEFQDQNGTFIIHNPENYSGLYLPMAGEKGLKSSITPNLGGDCKTDQNHFLLEPVSIENLHNNRNTRNFWCRVYSGQEETTTETGSEPEKKAESGKWGIWSVCGESARQEAEKFTDQQEESILEAGFMWQKLSRKSVRYGLKAEVTSFITLEGAMEVEYVEISNISEKNVEIVPIGAIPIYGRSADNLRDHRHVTSLLHRIHTTDYGVEVTPVLSFDERGHQKNRTTYFVSGSTENGEKPEEFYPTVEAFIGEGGSFLNPEAVRSEKHGIKSGNVIQGKEAVGGIKFSRKMLKPGEKTGYILLAGIAECGFGGSETEIGKHLCEISEAIEKLTSSLRTKAQVMEMFENVKKHWIQKVNVAFETGDKEADNYLKWICFQPILRRIYGCSFLPYHDYGKGGRGWRDLWQDCLALLIMEPSDVRQMIVDNYAGVRIDGTNATIIGNKQGEFIADRNNITRVWMDHSFWPFVTTKLYLDQTGDFDILFEKIPYFKDPQSKRGTKHDEKWDSSYGNRQKTDDGKVYLGTVLEHILLQNLCAFFDVGDHNEMRLHGADWNDALDMAWEKGESVAFTCAYAGNLKEIAVVLRELERVRGMNKIEIAEEIECLFAYGEQLYNSPQNKQKLLQQYTELCAHNLCGNTIVLPLNLVYKNLEEKAEWLMDHIRKNEWIQDKDKGWFNGYYDNHGNAVEHSAAEKENVRMMLTGQVFAIMSGTATGKQIQAICKSADTYLYDKKAGGYRLNTDFQEEKFDLGRMFGFAYGEKENGAVFSHMAVMYANALYKTGHAKEGHKVLQTLLDTAMDFQRSKMYPGIPEYFDNQGRGLYAYLTGAASWYMLTMITEVFGVKGRSGDLVIAPALMAEQYDENGNAALHLEFAGRKFVIRISNPKKKEWDEIQIQKAFCDGKTLLVEEVLEEKTASGEAVSKQQKRARLERAKIENLPAGEVHEIDIILG